MTSGALVLNAGSSSLKFALYHLDGGELRLAFHGKVEGSSDEAYMSVENADGSVLKGLDWEATPIGQDSFLTTLVAFAEEQLGGEGLTAVGHRIVHGGTAFHAPVVITEDILTQLDALCPLAPLHQAHNLAAVRAIRAIRPSLPQAACFDTAFHHGHADVVTRFALPRAWHDRGVRRYGFHGLSYEYISHELRRLDPKLAAGRVVVAHLGNGASLCAIQDGRSVDTTMGFTALDGLVMGTRCGALDPGAVLYLQQQAGMTVEAVSTMLYEQSGLLGVSGLSADMRTLIASSDPAAKEAIDLFTFRVAREIGALMTSLGGLDGIVFTAGIGENVLPVRADVARHLAWTGVRLNAQADVRGAGVLSTPDSPVKVWVIPTNEEAMIARHTTDLVVAGKSP